MTISNISEAIARGLIASCKTEPAGTQSLAEQLELRPQMVTVHLAPEPRKSGGGYNFGKRLATKPTAAQQIHIVPR